MLKDHSPSIIAVGGILAAAVSFGSFTTYHWVQIAMLEKDLKTAQRIAEDQVKTAQRLAEEQVKGAEERGKTYALEKLLSITSQERIQVRRQH